MAEEVKMSLDEYLSEKLWPLSTQIDQHRLDLNCQLMIDAVNFDGLNEGGERGVQVAGELKAKFKPSRS